MEGLEIYFFIRFIYGFFIIMSLVLTLLMVRPLNRYRLVNTFAIGMFLIITAVVSITNALIAGYLSDGIYPGGDEVISYLFMILFILSVLNVLIYIIYFVKKENNTKRNSAN